MYKPDTRSLNFQSPLRAKVLENNSFEVVIFCHMTNAHSLGTWSSIKTFILDDMKMRARVREGERNRINF